MTASDTKVEIEFEIAHQREAQPRSAVLIACRKFLRHYDVLTPIPTPELDARLIFLQATKITDLEFAANPQATISPEQIDLIETLLRRRAKGEPVSRLLGEREFYSLPFKITDATLDPRPDSETLIDVALEQMNALPADDGVSRRVLDLGTGSGCLLISLLSQMPGWSGEGVDINPAAVAVARDNAKHLGLENRTVFYQSTWFDKVSGSFDMIISNPPYIPTRNIEALSPDVRLYDPLVALDGGSDGMDAYRDIIAQAEKYLSAQGQIIFEIGFDQANSVKKILGEHNFTTIAVEKDLQGNDRIIVSRIAE